MAAAAVASPTDLYASKSPLPELPADIPDGSRYFRFDIVMFCGGCSGAITRVLERIKEPKDTAKQVKLVEFFKVDQPGHIVDVVTLPGVTWEDVYMPLEKTKKVIKSSIEIDPKTKTLVKEFELPKKEEEKKE